ncbi:hypothetical protein L7F22_046767 [Adiantum nelumboides]|nr:hypothetical protein [Adiantum nelumboides]
MCFSSCIGICLSIQQSLVQCTDSSLQILYLSFQLPVFSSSRFSIWLCRLAICNCSVLAVSIMCSAPCINLFAHPSKGDLSKWLFCTKPGTTSPVDVIGFALPGPCNVGGVTAGKEVVVGVLAEELEVAEIGVLCILTFVDAENLDFINLSWNLCTDKPTVAGTSSTIVGGGSVEQMFTFFVDVAFSVWSTLCFFNEGLSVSNVVTASTLPGTGSVNRRVEDANATFCCCVISWLPTAASGIRAGTLLFARKYTG